MVGIIALHTCEINHCLVVVDQICALLAFLCVLCLVCAYDFWYLVGYFSKFSIVSVMAIIKGEGDEPLQTCSSWETLDRKPNPLTWGCIV